MANTVVIFDSWRLAAFRQQVNASATHRMYLLNAAPTDIDTSSFASSVSALVATSASGGDADKQLTNVKITKSAAGVIKWDCNDITFTATAGQSLNVQYGLVKQSSVDIPMFYWEISSAPVVATQFGISVPASGFWETSDNV
jgi:hypothetical protein